MLAFFIVIAVAIDAMFLIEGFIVSPVLFLPGLLLLVCIVAFGKQFL